MHRFIAPLVLSLVLSQAANAQHDPSDHSERAGTHRATSPSPTAHTPYAGLEKRVIKALSDQQVDDLKNGRGMSLALPAELNGYPGPAHVLELADQLGLTPTQKRRVSDLHASMQVEAVQIGARLIEDEIALDRLFAGSTATFESASEATAASAIAQGKLRNAHLKYHLATVEVLSAEQRDIYAALRGYRSQ
jgi:Spy/CpxP family protein refolding chaperone